VTESDRFVKVKDDNLKKDVIFRPNPVPTKPGQNLYNALR